MAKHSDIESHFDEVFSHKPQEKYAFDPRSMARKDRRIVEILRRFGVRGKHCLDVGPGTGRWLTFLKLEEAAYLGAIDISDQVLDRCAPLCHKTMKADLEADTFDFESDFFDIVVSFEVLEHLRNPDLYLSEITRVARSGAIVLISLPNITSFISRVRLLLGALPPAITLDKTHIRFYRQQEITAILAKFGQQPKFIPTTISLNPKNPKSNFAVAATPATSSLCDSHLFYFTLRK